MGQFIQALSEELHLKWWLTEEDNWKVAAAVAADKNKDGLVSWSEFIEFLTPLLKDAFSRRPSDNDWVALETKVCLHSASALHVHVAWVTGPCSRETPVPFFNIKLSFLGF